MAKTTIVSLAKKELAQEKQSRLVSAVKCRLASIADRKDSIERIRKEIKGLEAEIEKLNKGDTSFLLDLKRAGTEVGYGIEDRVVQFSRY